MSGEELVQIGAALIASASILWLAASNVRRRSQRNAGYGIAALGSLDLGPRRVNAEVVRVPDLTRSWGAGTLVERAFTVVTVPHSGHVANAVAHPGASAGDVDNESLSLLIPEWRVAENETETEIDLDALSFVRGFVAVEPEQIRYVEAGDLLEPNYLREVVEKLINVSEQLERDLVPAQPVA